MALRTSQHSLDPQPALMGTPRGRPECLVLLWLRPGGGAQTGENPSYSARAQSPLPGHLCAQWLSFILYLRNL